MFSPTRVLDIDEWHTLFDEEIDRSACVALAANRLSFDKLFLLGNVESELLARLKNDIGVKMLGDRAKLVALVFDHDEVRAAARQRRDHNSERAHATILADDEGVAEQWTAAAPPLQNGWMVKQTKYKGRIRNYYRFGEKGEVYDSLTKAMGSSSIASHVDDSRCGADTPISSGCVVSSADCRKCDDANDDGDMTRSPGPLLAVEDLRIGTAVAVSFEGTQTEEGRAWFIGRISVVQGLARRATVKFNDGDVRTVALKLLRHARNPGAKRVAAAMGDAPEAPRSSLVRERRE